MTDKMHIVNAMFGKGLGGIEQCAVDYAEALSSQSHHVTCLIHPEAQIKSQLLALNHVHVVEIKNHGAWDIFAKHRTRTLLKQLKPDMMIAHGNRAIHLLDKIPYPLIAVTHNYKLKHFKKADAVIAITDDLAKQVQHYGVNKAHIYRLSNMIRPLDKAAKERSILRMPPVIGSMGRFVKKKGFDVFLQALAELKQQNVAFKAIIAGDGEEKATLKQLCHSLELDEHVTFSGWIKNKQELFDNIDIFCIPSHHEPFGIIILESLLRAVPTISTSSEGPREILSDGENALLTEIGHSTAMAQAIKRLIEDKALYKKLSIQGKELVEQNYCLEHVGKKLSDILNQIKNSYNM